MSSVVPVSAVQQSDSVTHTYAFFFSVYSVPLRFVTGYCVPWDIQDLVFHNCFLVQMQN